MTGTGPNSVSRKHRSAFVATLLAALLGLFAYLGVGISYAAQTPSHALFEKIFQSMPRDGSWFWTGRVNGVSVEAAAASRATDSGGYTLETRLKEQDVAMPAFNQRDAASVAIWEDASRTYAARAKGVVRVMRGTEVRAGNVWDTIEFPALRTNIHVEWVIEINAVTGEEKVIYEQDGEL